MDFTEQYCRMCEGASEIQESWDPSFGDFVWHKPGRLAGRLSLEEQVFLVYDRVVSGDIARFGTINFAGLKASFSASELPCSEVAVWLLRVDQLQAIDAAGSSVVAALGLDQWCSENCEYASLFSFSPERLWLAFVMDGLFSARWGPGKDAGSKESWVCRGGLE